MRRSLLRSEIPDTTVVAVYPAFTRYGRPANRRVFHLLDANNTIACGGFPSGRNDLMITTVEDWRLRLCLRCSRSWWAHKAILGEQTP